MRINRFLSWGENFLKWGLFSYFEDLAFFGSFLDYVLFKNQQIYKKFSINFDLRR